jgi:hypothetical protein
MFRGLLRERRSAVTVLVAAGAVASALCLPGAATGGALDQFAGAHLEVRSSSFAGIASVTAGIALGDGSGGVPVAAHVDLSVPAGYSFDPATPAGTTIGSALALGLNPKDANDESALLGDLVVEDATAYAADPAAQACAPGTHAAYWKASVESLTSSTTLVMPIAVDTATDASGATTYVLRFCPIAAPSTDNPSGLSLVLSYLTFDSITVPATTGVYQWSALVTPATATLTPDPTTAFELRGNVPIPQELTLKAQYQPKSHTVVLTGHLLMQSQPRGGVQVSVSRESDPLTEAVATTKADGTFQLKERLTRSESFDATVGSTSGPCAAPSSAPGGCRDESLAGADSTTAVAVVRRATDPKLVAKSRDQAVARKSIVLASDLPGATPLGDAPPPCAAYAPSIHTLTETGEQRSSWYLTGDRNAEIYTTSAVFKTVADAKADQAAVGQRTAALCEAQDVAGSNASVGSLKQLTLPKIGDTARSFRATIPSPGNPTINVDLVVIRVARVVITLHVISLGSANTLEVKVARALARRAR